MTEENSIDFVICSGVFIHITDIKVISGLFAEAKRVLKPNGHFRFNVRYWNPETSFANSFGGLIIKFLIRNNFYTQSPKLNENETDFNGFKFRLSDLENICNQNQLCLNSVYFQDTNGNINNGLVRVNTTRL